MVKKILPYTSAILITATYRDTCSCNLQYVQLICAPVAHFRASALFRGFVLFLPFLRYKPRVLVTFAANCIADISFIRTCNTTTPTLLIQSALQEEHEHAPHLEDDRVQFVYAGNEGWTLTESSSESPRSAKGLIVAR